MTTRSIFNNVHFTWKCARKKCLSSIIVENCQFFSMNLHIWKTDWKVEYQEIVLIGSPICHIPVSGVSLRRSVNWFSVRYIGYGMSPKSVFQLDLSNRGFSTYRWVCAIFLSEISGLNEWNSRKMSDRISKWEKFTQNFRSKWVKFSHTWRKHATTVQKTKWRGPSVERPSSEICFCLCTGLKRVPLLMLSGIMPLVVV
jgi:hypothetical protein